MMIAIVVGGVVGVGTAAALFTTIFGGWDGFVECVRFWFTPDVLSLFRGEYEEDWWSELKIGAWLAISALTGFAAYTGVMQLVG
jgi:phosphate/sulfate permease